MRYIRGLIADVSPSTQLILIGLLAVSLAALFSRALVFFYREKAGGPVSLSECMECSAVPSVGRFSAAGWPCANLTLGDLP